MKFIRLFCLCILNHVHCGPMFLGFCSVEHMGLSRSFIHKLFLWYFDSNIEFWMGLAPLRLSWEYLLNYLVISAEAIPSSPSWLCWIGLRWTLISTIETPQVLLCQTEALLVTPGGKHCKQYMFRLEFLHECNIMDGPFEYSRSGNCFWMFQYKTGNGDVGSICCTGW